MTPSSLRLPPTGQEAAATPAFLWYRQAALALANRAELIGQLCAISGPFAMVWGPPPRPQLPQRVRTYNHPEVGPLTLAEESLELPEDKGRRLTLETAEPGSASAERMLLLARLRSSLRGLRC